MVKSKPDQFPNLQILDRKVNLEVLQGYSVDDLKFKVITESDIWLETAYRLLADQFDPSVLDPLEIYVDQMEKNKRGSNELCGLMVAAYFKVGEKLLLVGVVSGSIIRILEHEGKHPETLKNPYIFAIGHQVTAKVLRSVGYKGVGTKLWEFAVEEASRKIHERQGTLQYSVLEAEKESVGFWSKRGYLWPKGVSYWQPPIEFDRNGDFLYPEVPEVLLLKPREAQNADRISALLLKDIVATIYHYWALKKYEDLLSDEAFEKARQYVFDDLFTRFSEKIPTEGSIKLISDFRRVGDVIEVFNEILKNIGDGAYDKCSSSSALFLESFSKIKEAREYIPYAKFFRVFSEAYRIWQVSYDYPKIRHNLRLASFAINENIPQGHETLVQAFRSLGDLICLSVSCENAFINNDPFSLRAYTAEFLALEDKASKKLAEFQTDDLLLFSISKWLNSYFEIHRYFYQGVNNTAKLSCDVFEKKPMENFGREIQSARDELAKLGDIPDFASILNAYISHLQRHHDRLHGWNRSTSFLRVSKGKLVLALSATLDDEWLRKNIYRLENFPDTSIVDFEQNKDFEGQVTAAFRDSDIPIKNFRTLALHDIFQSAFGNYYSQNIAFDLPNIRLSLLHKKDCVFETSINISTLGVCTVYFALDIEKVEGETGLTVEEIRMLQSCICPHAGEIRLDFIQRPDYDKLKVELDLITTWIKDNRDLPDLKKITHELDYTVERVKQAKQEVEKLNSSKQQETQGEIDEIEGHNSARKPNAAIVKHLIEIIEGLRAIQRLEIVSKYGEELDFHKLKVEAFITKLNSICNTYAYLSEISCKYLQIINELFEAIDHDTEESDRKSDKSWLLSPATGWYTYLSASSIDIVYRDGAAIDKQVGFDVICAHPDTIGFQIEQREARAGFDDWRFMKTGNMDDQNMAHIRSHDVDAFFGSEYQSFLYFPDDPQYLTDQYEETVRLMGRLGVILKHYNTHTYDLIREVRTDFADLNEKAKIGEQMSTLRFYLRKIDRIRLGAGVMISLTANAGISRYKDHGDLMKKIVERMKMNAVVESIDGHLANLDILARNVLTSLETRREKRFNYFVVFLTLVFTVPAIEIIVNALFDIFRPDAATVLDDPTKGPTDIGRAWLTLGLWAVVVVGSGIFIWIRGSSGEGLGRLRVSKSGIGLRNSSWKTRVTRSIGPWWRDLRVLRKK